MSNDLEVLSWPSNWQDQGVLTCDWGGCDEIATKARYDARSHEWLPVCDRCAMIQAENDNSQPKEN